MFTKASILYNYDTPFRIAIAHTHLLNRIMCFISIIISIESV